MYEGEDEGEDEVGCRLSLVVVVSGWVVYSLPFVQESN